MPRLAPRQRRDDARRFDETADGGLTVLTVETFDRPGLLLAITRALHRARVQIIASEATTKDGRVVDRFSIVELDGAPLRANRRGVLQVEVLAAIDSLGRRRPPGEGRRIDGLRSSRAATWWGLRVRSLRVVPLDVDGERRGAHAAAIALVALAARRRLALADALELLGGRDHLATSEEVGRAR